MKLFGDAALLERMRAFFQSSSSQTGAKVHVNPNFVPKQQSPQSRQLAPAKTQPSTTTAPQKTPEDLATAMLKADLEALAQQEAELKQQEMKQQQQHHQQIHQHQLSHLTQQQQAQIQLIQQQLAQSQATLAAQPHNALLQQSVALLQRQLSTALASVQPYVPSTSSPVVVQSTHVPTATPSATALNPLGLSIAVGLPTSVGTIPMPVSTVANPLLLQQQQIQQQREQQAALQLIQQQQKQLLLQQQQIQALATVTHQHPPVSTTGANVIQATSSTKDGSRYVVFT
jgi:hypothetical protein